MGLAATHELQPPVLHQRPRHSACRHHAGGQLCPAIFVSPEDVVWQENRPAPPRRRLFRAVTTSALHSTVIPDLSLSKDAFRQTRLRVNDFRFSWMITAQQNNTSNGVAFDGNIVVFENRPFSLISQRWGGPPFTRRPAKRCTKACSGQAPTSGPRAARIRPGCRPDGARALARNRARPRHQGRRLDRRCDL